MVNIEWLRWFNSLLAAVNASSASQGSVTASAASAAVVTANIPVNLPTNSQGISAGRYRISWYLRISRAATVSSAAQVTVGWTDGAIALTKAGASVNGNTTFSYDTGSVFVNADALSNFTYAVSYTSSGATSMQYELAVTVEMVP